MKDYKIEIRLDFGNNEIGSFDTRVVETNIKKEQEQEFLEFYLSETYKNDRDLKSMLKHSTITEIQRGQYD